MTPPVLSRRRKNIGVGRDITDPVIGWLETEPQFVHGPERSGANSKEKSSVIGEELEKVITPSAS
jgi:hypothetical protein